jgi:hypothetical protein
VRTPPKRPLENQPVPGDPSDSFVVGGRVKFGDADATIIMAEWRKDKQGNKAFIIFVQDDNGTLGALKVEDDGSVSDLGQEFKKYKVEMN